MSNCKAGTAARRESIEALTTRLSPRHQTNHELQLATFASQIPINPQSVRLTLTYLSSSKSVNFISREFLKPRILAVHRGFFRKSTSTPPRPSYQYSIREAKRSYKEHSTSTGTRSLPLVKVLATRKIRISRSYWKLEGNTSKNIRQHHIRSPPWPQHTSSS
jgi:hypothetical protein